MHLVFVSRNDPKQVPILIYCGFPCYGHFNRFYIGKVFDFLARP